MTSTPSEPGYSNICITKTLNSILANTAASSPQQQWGLKPCASWQGLDWWPPPPRRQLGGGSWPWVCRRRWRGRGGRSGWRRGQGEATVTQSREDWLIVFYDLILLPLIFHSDFDDLVILWNKCWKKKITGEKSIFFGLNCRISSYCIAWTPPSSIFINIWWTHLCWRVFLAITVLVFISNSHCESFLLSWIALDLLLLVQQAASLLHQTHLHL